MILNAQVNDRDFKLESSLIQEEQINTAEIDFTFDESWNDYTKYVMFENKQSGEIYKRAIIDNVCIIPTLSEGYVNIQVYGEKINGDTIEKRQPTNLQTIRIVNSIDPKKAGDSVKENPTEWDTYMAQVSKQFGIINGALSGQSYSINQNAQGIANNKQAILSLENTTESNKKDIENLKNKTFLEITQTEEVEVED